MMIKYYSVIITLILLLSFPATGQIRISHGENPGESIFFLFESESEADLDEYIRRSKELVEYYEMVLPQVTKAYEELAKSDSTPLVPTPEDYKKKIRQLEKTKELLELELKSRLYRERLFELYRQDRTLPKFSPRGLRQTKNLAETIEILSTAKKLRLYAVWPAIRGWETRSFGYPYDKDPALSIDNPVIIQSIYEFIKNAGFKYDSEWTQNWLEGGAIGTKQNIVIEVDDKAHVYFLSDMLICEQKKTYTTQQFDENGTISFHGQFWSYIPLENLKK